MGEREGKELERAVRAFVGKLRGRRLAQRRPDLVPTLVDLYHASSNSGVRSACVSAIIELTEEAPPVFLEALSDPDPWVVCSGISALHYFPNPAAIGPLRRFVESRVNPLISENAMSMLGIMGDEAAVPTLAGVLLDTSNLLDQSFGTAAIALGRCGRKGYEALVSALDHADPRVRLAAVAGVDCSSDSSAGEHLARLRSDADPKVRDRAEMRFRKRTIDA
jgi:HEAT repeat protein